MWCETKTWERKVGNAWYMTQMYWRKNPKPMKRTKHRFEHSFTVLASSNLYMFLSSRWNVATDRQPSVWRLPTLPKNILSDEKMWPQKKYHLHDLYIETRWWRKWRVRICFILSLFSCDGEDDNNNNVRSRHPLFYSHNLAWRFAWWYKVGCCSRL